MRLLMCPTGTINITWEQFKTSICRRATQAPASLCVSCFLLILLLSVGLGISPLMYNIDWLLALCQNLLLTPFNFVYIVLSWCIFFLLNYHKLAGIQKTRDQLLFKSRSIKNKAVISSVLCALYWHLLYKEQVNLLGRDRQSKGSRKGGNQL